ncbi:succinyl-diaminopimelate desuccinylase [compost metagenome]
MLAGRAEETELPDAVRKDLGQAGQTWLFGRGVMDMKCGIALHMSLLEQAAYGDFEGNLLMLSVPDEEANSVGMRKAVPLLVKLAEEWGLDYRLALNSEPVFPRYPGDEGLYVYTGSIGKMLPGYLCYGQETHVGEPFSGFNANYMAAVLTAELEWSAELSEFGPGQSTPPPTNLLHRDMSPGYSAQVPHRAAVLFNLLQMARPARETLMLLKRAAYRAASRMEEDFADRAQAYAEKSPFPIPQPRVNVFTYEELLALASERHGEAAAAEAVNRRLAELRGGQQSPEQEPDGREATIAVADALAAMCKDLAPMIILFVAPPFYPAVASGEAPPVLTAVEQLTGYAREAFGLEMALEPYFRGISDLSYIGSPQSADMINTLAPNMPLWGRGYEIPFADMSRLQMPVLNVGPVGRDAHKRTERLEADYAFNRLPLLLSVVIRTFLEKS